MHGASRKNIDRPNRSSIPLNRPMKLYLPSTRCRLRRVELEMRHSAPPSFISSLKQEIFLSEISFFTRKYFEWKIGSCFWTVLGAPHDVRLQSGTVPLQIVPLAVSIRWATSDGVSEIFWFSTRSFKKLKNYGFRSVMLESWKPCRQQLRAVHAVLLSVCI